MKKRYFVYMLILLYLLYQNNILQISKNTISTNKLNTTITVAHLSDIHNTKSQVLQTQIVQSLQDEAPDYIVITGDLIDSRRTDIDAAVSFVKKMKDIAPIYYVNGNHESRISDYYDLENLLLELGVVILKDSKVTLEDITFIGLSDPDFSNTYQLQQNLEQLSSNAFTILLSHRPELFSTYVKQNVDVVFCGHAHGGQIRIPFVGGMYAPHQGFLPSYTEGMHTENTTTMIVSRGIGNSLFPFRINNRPELIYTTIGS